MKRPRLFFATAWTLLAAVACRKQEPGTIYEFHGTVVRLDPSSNVAYIHNEKIAGWMDAMTMEYPIGNKDEFKSLQPGQHISAQLTVTADGYSLTRVRPEQSK